MIGIIYCLKRHNDETDYFIDEIFYLRIVGLPLPPPLYSQSKMDSELSTRKFRVRSDSNSRPIRRDVVKGFEHRVSKFMFCPIELRVDDLLSEEFPQSLDQV